MYFDENLLILTSGQIELEKTIIDSPKTVLYTQINVSIFLFWLQINKLTILPNV